VPPSYHRPPLATDGDSTDPRAGLKAGVLTRLLAEGAAPADVDPAGAALLPGAEVGRFVLEREIGRGGFGRVFEARDRELNRHVALKVLRPRPEALGAEGDLLRQEGEAAAQLTHENVVTVHELGRCEWGVYLVLELLEGETLAERLSRGPLPVDEAVRIAAGVASALAHAHARGVLHRDLKPSNVFLCKDGAPKVLDFGLARVFGGPSPAGGTPQYMAPEQWFDHPQDERTDLFSLGVLLFEALAGQRPFKMRDGLSSSLDPLPAPELPASAGPRALRRLVARCLEKRPGERPAGAPEVLAALERLMPERRARRRLLLGAAAFGALLLAVAGSGGGVRRSSTRSRIV